ncbi:PREDICTED: histone deacetylase 10 [Elephantulus edwardii]|uniref:histone deacetylase 10 n=1 Tax=Elephantulus edwardii TaxID=28737 RepID=UPI0003F0629A|nr:PREDICTED: histone deacetylase 10 [Elephantulus edwardii]
MGTALVYHEDMAMARLLWDDPECEIECPERLTTALERLRQRGLEQRCLRLEAREATEAELGLVHSPDYVAVVRGTQALDTTELRALSGQYDAVYFHPSTFHCARLAVGAVLQLVDAVLTGAAHNGLALVRPPGHHSQQAVANGFCVFNNVAIAAEHARRKYGLKRILIVDWDVHHGQGIQYIFEDDPGVLYFSWHRYEHGHFWPFLPESDAGMTGQGPGQGFTVNLPWNQVGMENADYVAAFLHVLLPLAFEFDPELVLISAGFDSAIGDPEGQMRATPECFHHLTQLLVPLAGGRVCTVLEGGYHLESLAESVCMTVRALLGDPALPLSGTMVPCWSALESIQRVRAAQAPHWTSLQLQDVAPMPRPRACSSEGRPPPTPGSPEYAGAAAAAAAEAAVALSSFLDRLRLHPQPPVRTAIVLTSTDDNLVLPPGVVQQERSAQGEEMEAWARPRVAMAQDVSLTVLGKVLTLVDGILDGQVSNGIAATPTSAAGDTLDMAIQRGLYLGAQRLLCLVVGQLDRPSDLADDGRILWLNIGSQKAEALSMFHISVPKLRATGSLLSCILGLVLPLAYGFKPDLVLVALGPSHGLEDTHAALLAAMLRGPSGGRILALVQESRPQLAEALARVLSGEAPPRLGPCSMTSLEDAQCLNHLRRQLAPRWKMLQVADSAAPPPSLGQSRLSRAQPEVHVRGGGTLATSSLCRPVMTRRRGNAGPEGPGAGGLRGHRETVVPRLRGSAGRVLPACQGAAELVDHLAVPSRRARGSAPGRL